MYDKLHTRTGHQTSHKPFTLTNISDSCTHDTLCISHYLHYPYFALLNYTKTPGEIKGAQDRPCTISSAWTYQGAAYILPSLLHLSITFSHSVKYLYIVPLSLPHSYHPFKIAGSPLHLLVAHVTNTSFLIHLSTHFTF